MGSLAAWKGGTGGGHELLRGQGERSAQVGDLGSVREKVGTKIGFERRLALGRVP